MAELGMGRAGMSQHFILDKKCGAYTFTKINESKIFFSNLGVNFFRIGKTGRIIQYVDGEIRESLLYFLDRKSVV